MREVAFIGAAIGVGSGIRGCEKAPYLLAKKTSFNRIFQYERGGGDAEEVASYFSRLGEGVYEISAKSFPIVIGGDHSCAMGTWSGLSARHRDIGLIWVDAHMDSHIPETTPSGNIHGMPLAVLLGHGDKRFTSILGEQTKLKPENVILVGVRSYESEEAALLKSLNIKIYFIEEIIRQGIQCVLTEAFQQLAEYGSIGFSVDMDAFDPKYVPGVGNPAPNGICPDEFIRALQGIDLTKCCGVEIAEYNPDLDRDGLTQNWVLKLIGAFQAKYHYRNSR